MLENVQDNYPPIPSSFPEETGKPFIIELEQRERSSPGYFRPFASLKIDRSLRTSELLLALPPEDVKNLLFVLTFLHPNGYCHATVQELSQWMRVSEGKVRARMERLLHFEWQGTPLLVELKRASGLDAYTPSQEILAVVERPAPLSEAAKAIPIRAAGREAVIAHSRERYARPRAEVEREIARLNGWDVPEEFATEEERNRAAVREKLLIQGVSKVQAEDLLARFDLEQIRRQIAWLPFRNAKSPARYLVAAIAGDYDPPAHLRLKQAMVTMEQNTQEQAEQIIDEPNQETTASLEEETNLPA